MELLHQLQALLSPMVQAVAVVRVTQLLSEQVLVDSAVVVLAMVQMQPLMPALEVVMQQVTALVVVDPMVRLVVVMAPQEWLSYRCQQTH